MPGPGGTNFVVIDDFLIDCSLRESHNYDSDVTDYPTESGANVSDNIRPLPITVEIEGIVSNSPIGLMVRERVQDKKPSVVALEIFEAIRDDRKPVTITTSLRTYENMALKSLTIPRGDHEDALKFTASFQQIKTVENKREIRVSTPIATRGGTAVTKSPEASNNRLILIDRANSWWYDPDFTRWRYLASFRKELRQTSGDAVITVYNKWYLERNTDVVSLQGAQFYPSKDIISVPLSNCILAGFQITSSPGQFTPKPYPRTDAAR